MRALARRNASTVYRAGLTLWMGRAAQGSLLADSTVFSTHVMPFLSMGMTSYSKLDAATHAQAVKKSYKARAHHAA